MHSVFGTDIHFGVFACPLIKAFKLAGKALQLKKWKCTLHMRSYLQKFQKRGSEHLSPNLIRFTRIFIVFMADGNSDGSDIETDVDENDTNLGDIFDVNRQDVDFVRVNTQKHGMGAILTQF